MGFVMPKYAIKAAGGRFYVLLFTISVLQIKLIHCFYVKIFTCLFVFLLLSFK